MFCRQTIMLRSVTDEAAILIAKCNFVSCSELVQNPHNVMQSFSQAHRRLGQTFLSPHTVHDGSVTARISSIFSVHGL